MRKIDRKQNFITFERLYWQLSREMSYQWRKIYNDTLPGSQSHILSLLQRKGPQKMSELAGHLHLTPGAVTTASDRLIEQNYIARVRDKTDRRVTRIEITEKGTATLNELRNEGRKIMKTIFADVTDSELEELNEIFQQATTNLKQMNKEENE